MPDVIFNPNAQGGTFDMQSLEAFANQNDNSKLLVTNAGDVSVKNAFTSRLPGNAQARLNASAAFLNTIKETYGEEVAIIWPKTINSQRL